MYFGLLGPLMVRAEHGYLTISAPRQRILLAALLLKAGRVVTAEELTEAIWAGQPPRGTQGALHSAVQRLRLSLGDGGRSLIITRPPGYLIEPGEDGIDIRGFERLAARATAAAAAGQWPRAAEAAREALELCRGEPLADVPSPLLRAREVPYLTERRLRVLGVRIDADLRLGRHSELVAELRQLVTAHPLREGYRGQLMLALFGAGQQADALAVYQDMRRLLADELGVDPSPDLQAVHQRILTADPGLSGAASGGGRGHPVPAQLPAAPRHFVGRADELKALGTLLVEPTGLVMIAAISGTAGIGKTALAVHFAHQVAERFPDGQLYVNLHGFDPAGPPLTAAEAIRGFLDGFQVGPQRMPASLAAQAALYRSLLAGQRVLVLLDNARDAEQVRPLLPGSPGCMVIITSRSQLTSLVATDGAHPLTLGLPAAWEARELLTSRLGAERILGEPGAAEELIKLCARLPLALSITASRAAAHPGFPLGLLAAELRATGTPLDALDAGDARSNMRAVFSWSYRQLSEPAARLFRLLGLHPGPDVSAPAAASLAGLPMADVRAALTELTRAHLLAEHPPGRFAFHDLLHAYAAELAAAQHSPAERQAATGRLLDHYLHTANTAALLLSPTRDPVTLSGARPGVTAERLATARQALAWFEAERLVLLAASMRAADTGFDIHAWQLPWTLARFLDTRAYWPEWLSIARTALAAAERLGDPAAQADACHRLGSALARLREFGQAQLLMQRAQDLYAGIGDPIGQANVCISLAAESGNQGRHADGLRHAQRALDLAASAGNRAYQALARNAVGWYHAQLGDYQQALAHCHQALRLHLESGDESGQAHTLDSLGYAYHHLGQHAQAIACYRRALDIRTRLGDRYLQARTLDRLGEIHHDVRDPRAAREAWERSAAILDDLSQPAADQIRAKLRRPPR
jgi:DNA-binding SARP family transcriptional activator/tetratricopeptide (TPR) repeat protein